jgi:hypothetical protein
MLLWRCEYLVWLEDADIRFTTYIAVRYLYEVGVGCFGLELFSDENFASVLTCLRIVITESLKIYIIEPDKFLPVELL